MHDLLMRWPRAAVHGWRDWRRERGFDDALQEFMRDPAQAAAGTGDLFERLVTGWGNEAWSGQAHFLRACVRHALACDGPVLECGSGLSTVLVGAALQGSGRNLWSLEHLPPWAERLNALLRRFRIATVRLCVAPLRDHGGFDWYSPPLEDMPAQFALVLCDGPPAQTRGGRYGLVPVMGERIRGRCTILLDDAVRTEEQQIARQWSALLGTQLTLRGRDHPYYELQPAV